MASRVALGGVFALTWPSAKDQAEADANSCANGHLGPICSTGATVDAADMSTVIRISGLAAVD